MHTISKYGIVYRVVITCGKNNVKIMEGFDQELFFENETEMLEKLIKLKSDNSIRIVDVLIVDYSPTNVRKYEI